MNSTTNVKKKNVPKQEPWYFPPFRWFHKQKNYIQYSVLLLILISFVLIGFAFKVKLTPSTSGGVNEQWIEIKPVGNVTRTWLSNEEYCDKTTDPVEGSVYLCYKKDTLNNRFNLDTSY